MIVFREPGEVPAHFGPSVVVIGKFDGVHSGHRAVIDRARVTAADADVYNCLDPHARGSKPLASAHTLGERLHAIEHRMHIDHDVAPVNDQLRRARSTQSGVQHGTES